jgi:hypothetical protein
MDSDNVAGVHLPMFKTFEKGKQASTPLELTGLSKGGQEIKKSREVHIKAIESLIELASLQVHPFLHSFNTQHLLPSSFLFLTPTFRTDCFHYS